MNYTKENAIEKCLEVIFTSWTYQRLTPAEAVAWDNLLIDIDITGTAKQRYTQTMHLYQAFLRGCGYDGPYWREPEEYETPIF